MHSKNIRVKESDSLQNDPIWIKNASFNAFTGHTQVNFRTKFLTQIPGQEKKRNGGVWKEWETEKGLFPVTKAARYLVTQLQILNEYHN